MKFTIKTNDLKALLLCAAKNDIRYYLNGVYFESAPCGVIAAATDGHRLICISLPYEQADSYKAIIPRALVEAACKLKTAAKAHLASIDITIDNRSVTLSSAGQTISGMIEEGVFPDFRRVIPTSVTGEQGNQYNNEYLTDFDKAGKLLGGGKASIMQNGIGNSALVRFTRDDVIGVIMPFKHNLPDNLSRPDWL